MRIVYSDPLKELKTLIKEAKSDPQINHIAITPGELRACLKHAEAGSVFPQLMNERAKDLERVRKQLNKIRPMIAGNVLSDREKQPLFDQVDALEAEEEAITERIPHSISEGGVSIKVSMR